MPPANDHNASSIRVNAAREWLAAILAVVVTLFHIVALSMLTVDPWLFLGTSAHLFCVLVFVRYPIIATRPYLSVVVDSLMCMAAVAVIGYLALNVKDMYYRVGFAPTREDVIVGTVATVLILDMARRCLGLFFPLLGVAFIVYAVYGDFLPGIWGHRGYAFDRTISTLFSTEGLYGFAMDAAASYIVLFVTFGAFMEATGVGNFFIRFANAVAGRSRGGPAKVCVVASSMFGTISGSAMGNVVTTGTFTIPLMKRAGYPPAFAGGVEAAASTGGQIMPPIMGAVAFVLADATQTPYRDVMLAATIPAICYFATVFFVTDFEALKRGLTPGEGPGERVWTVLKEDWLLLVPIVVLLSMVVLFQRSIVQSALSAMGTAILVDMIRTRSLPRPKVIWNGLSQGGRASIQAAAACAAAGILVGVFGLTGLGNRFVIVATDLSGQMLIPAMFLVMLLTLMMGFPLPTVPAYVITAMIGAPVIVKLGGVEPLVAHLFVMYFACISTVTPPVGLAAFAAASIAGSNPYRTAFESMRLGLAAYVIPFVFVFNTHLLGYGEWYEVLSAIVVALAVAYAMACVVNSDYHPIARLLMLGTAVPMLWAGIVWDMIGIVLLIIVDYFGRKTSQSGSIIQSETVLPLATSNPANSPANDGSRR